VFRIRTWLGVSLIAVLAIGACSAQGAPAAKGSSFPPDAARVLARDEAFIGGSVAVPAGKTFNLVLDNRDGEPHNVTILGASGGAARFVGEVFSGPEARMYTVPALEAGSYQFRCDVHHDMTGTIVAG
jgi:plastocyanin